MIKQNVSKVIRVEDYNLFASLAWKKPIHFEDYTKRKFIHMN